MTATQRRALADLLARLIQDGEITEEQALALMLAVQDDSLAELMPLPPYYAITAPSPGQDDDRSVIPALLGIAAGALTSALANAITARQRRQAGQLFPADFDGLPQLTRIGIANDLAAWHRAEVADLAARLTRGDLSTSAWQQAMRDANRRLEAALTQAGAGSRAARFGQRLRNAGATQDAYLSRFADQIALRQLQGQPMTQAQIAARSAQYAGQGRRLFFEAYETAGHGETGPGWICQYVAMDDPATCSPCHRAEGYYLPGAGPYPGDVCAGEGNCRCDRYLLFDPVIYARLTGQSAPASPEGA